MKTSTLKWFFCSVLCTLLVQNFGFAQSSKTKFIDDNIAWRKNMNAEFRDTAESPLTKEGLLVFKEIEFFPIRSKYCVVAKLVLTPDEKPFEMPRSRGNTGTYRKYGIATFTIDGKECKLSVYQFMKLINDPQYRNDLFLPFKDLTNGKETYGGGRFIELVIPEGDELVLDFNKAYNPLCCYHNPKYSCPIPPAENHLQVKILAGEKKYKGEK
jgi:uncharacterized protein